MVDKIRMKCDLLLVMILTDKSTPGMVSHRSGPGEPVEVTTQQEAFEPYTGLAGMVIGFFKKR
jgi:hypothetical protein